MTSCRVRSKLVVVIFKIFEQRNNTGAPYHRVLRQHDLFSAKITQHRLEYELVDHNR
jgi:hypothetical protein